MCSKFTIFLDDKIRTTVQLITYTAPQNCLSLFTIHIHNCSIFVHISSEAKLQIFFLEGCHLSKIRLGANVSLIKTDGLILCLQRCSLLFFSHDSVDLSKSTTCLYFHSLIFSKYDIVKRSSHISITLINSLSNLIISSQRLVTMSASLHTQTVLCCLIIQVLNIKSLLPKCLIQSFHFCT